MSQESKSRTELPYEQRLDALRGTKLAQTREKQQVIGAMDHDDWALILPPPERREVVADDQRLRRAHHRLLLEGVDTKPNHPSGGFFGPQAVRRELPRAAGGPSRLHRPDELAGGRLHGQLQLLPRSLSGTRTSTSRICRRIRNGTS